MAYKDMKYSDDLVKEVAIGSGLASAKKLTDESTNKIKNKKENYFGY